MTRSHIVLSVTLAVLLLVGAGPFPGGRTASADPGPVPSAASAPLPNRLASAGSPAVPSQVARLTAADGMAWDYFGGTVSSDGHTAVVGAGGAAVGGNDDQGAAYVFYRDEGGPGAWGQEAKLTADDGVADDNFGRVAYDGDTAVVGAWTADVGGNSSQGAAYVFYRNQGGPDAWGQVAKLVADDGAASDLFGSRVAVAGDIAVIGAHKSDVGGHTDQGAAYVYYRNQGGPDAWGQVAKLTADDGTASDYFGYALSISGDTAVVGAYDAAVASNPKQGAAYVFYRHAGGPDAWGQVATLTAADGAAGDEFGFSTSLDGDTVLVGAANADVEGRLNQGAAYLFYRDLGGPDAWGQAAKVTAADGQAQDYFGVSSSLDGDTAVTGATGADVGGNLDQGAAWVFRRDEGGAGAWGQIAKLTADDGAASHWFGRSVSVSGGTVVSGADAAVVGGNISQGAAWVYRMSSLPVAEDDAYTTPEDTPLVVAGPGVLLNDADPDGDPLAAVLEAGPAHGTLDLHADGSFTYTPGSDWNGADAFTYRAHDGWDGSNVATVEITVSPLNDPPAAEDDAYTAAEDQPLVVAALGVLLNDTDADGDPLAAVLEAGPAHGTLDLHADGSFTYTPASGWNGLDAFTYRADDGQVASDPATVEITVSPVNDPPAAEDDAYTTAEDTPLEVSAPGLLLNDADADGDPLTAVLEAGPAHGTLELHADGSFIYTPTADYAGLDVFTYYADDGQAASDVAAVEITATPANDAPVAVAEVYSTAVNVPLVVAEPGVLGNDSDPEGDPLTAVLDLAPAHGTIVLDQDGSFLYVPAPHFFGVDSFTYHADDGEAGSNVVTVQITVAGHVVYLPLVLRGD